MREKEIASPSSFIESASLFPLLTHSFEGCQVTVERKRFPIAYLLMLPANIYSGQTVRGQEKIIDKFSNDCIKAKSSESEKS